jgi:LPXTG-site transpeptidase (sortase) family protein
MASHPDTLNIGSIRLRDEYPVAEVQSLRPADPVNHPDAAAAARARIAAISTSSYIHPETVPAALTSDLVTSREQLVKQIGSAPTVSRPKIPSAFIPMLTAVGVFLLVLLLFKAPIIISEISYDLNPKPAVPVIATQAGTIVPAADSITIPEINVHAPVIYMSSVLESDIENSLENGVIHYADTAVPGQVGNVAIFGHSSNDWWQPGNYKFVFVLLDKLEPGDQVVIDYNSTRYVYQVTGSQVVTPTDISVLDPTSTPTLSLITCTPPGTSLRRLVVTAKQISPSPQTATKPATTVATAQGTNSNLPSSAPSILSQITGAWDSVYYGIRSLFGGSTAPKTNQTSSQTPGGIIPAAN